MCACNTIQSSLGKLIKNSILHLNKFIESSRKTILLMEEKIMKKIE